MMQARARLGEALDRIRRIHGYESFLKEPGWQEIAAAAIEGQPLVYLAAAPAGGVALIVHRSRICRMRQSSRLIWMDSPKSASRSF